MSAIWLALVLGATGLAPAAPVSQPASSAWPAQEATDKEVLAQAKAALGAKDPQKAVDLVSAHLMRAMGSAELEDVLGQALLLLGRKDEAAHHFGAALRLHGDNEAPQKAIRANLAKADPFSTRRAALMKQIAKDLLETCQKLYETGHTERALAILGPLEPVATGPDKATIVALAAKIRAANEEVRLESDSGGEVDDGGRAAVRHEGKRYQFEANLEPDVLQRVSDVMDDIFNYYVQIYFDGDESRVVQQKPLIRIHGSREDMLKDWQGESTPEGWWSPGEWTVVCYDTTATSGDLDNMLMTLYHEASHHFMTMLAKGGNTPAWINEGTASFFEGAKAMRDRRVLWPDAASGRLYALHYQLSGGPGPSVAQVLAFNEPGSYAGDYYSFGWGLVYYLQQYEDPVTLEYVFRPLYSTYRETCASKRGDPLELFKQTFLTPGAPGGFTELDPWVAKWRDWILNEVYPLHKGARRRDLRLEKAQAYIRAADGAKLQKAPKVSEVELLTRALGHLEYVRTLDGPEKLDPALIVLQADVMERMGRPQSTAALLEQVLELVDEGKASLEEELYEKLEKRLTQLDKKNQPLRLAKTRSKNYAKRVLTLLDAYGASEVPMPLTAFEFARMMADALEHKPLSEAADDLRVKAREAGLLKGAVYKIGGKASAWMSIFDSGDGAFESTEAKIAIEGVRPMGRIYTAIPVNGEYEVRCTLGRVGEIARTTYQGVVFAGTPTTPWFVAGIDGKGQLLVRRYVQGGSEMPLKLPKLETPVAKDEHPTLSVRVHADNRITIRVGDRPAIEGKLDQPLPKTAYVGILAKNGRTELGGMVVEVFP